MTHCFVCAQCSGSQHAGQLCSNADAAAIAMMQKACIKGTDTFSSMAPVATLTLSTWRHHSVHQRGAQLEQLVVQSGSLPVAALADG